MRQQTDEQPRRYRRPKEEEVLKPAGVCSICGGETDAKHDCQRCSVCDQITVYQGNLTGHAGSHSKGKWNRRREID